MKQNFDAAAPGSDVVQFLLPEWPAASERDVVVCAEVKMKATANTVDPVGRAIEGCTVDRTSRLAKTLVWLRRRAVIDDLSGVDVATLNRFIEANLHPAAERRVRAVAVIDASSLKEEAGTTPEERPEDHEIILISFEGLRDA